MKIATLQLLALIEDEIEFLLHVDDFLPAKTFFYFFTGDKPHVCELCNKKFALACNLRAHLKTHEGKNEILESTRKFTLFRLFSGEPQEECVRCNKVYLVSSGETRQGLCTSCISSSNSPVIDVEYEDSNSNISDESSINVDDDTDTFKTNS